VSSLAKTFGKCLRAHRERARLTQPALAAKMGCALSFVSMLETGDRAPSLETVEHAAKVLKINPLKLLGA
jgi:transcriptional regulator with XRE-family HTH domain